MKQQLAVVVIDMQRDFVDKGAPIECFGGRETIPHITRLLERAREKNIPVIFTQEAHRKNKIDLGVELTYEPVHCLEGSVGIEIVASLPRNPEDYLIVKRRYSAFFKTDFEILLKGLGVNTLILTGVATDVCVRATAQDAQQSGYFVIVPKECVAGTSRARHEAALDNIGFVFGKVQPLQEVLDIIESN